VATSHIAVIVTFLRFLLQKLREAVAGHQALQAELRQEALRAKDVMGTRSRYSSAGCLR
jgi:hypothetical protein